MQIQVPPEFVGPIQVQEACKVARLSEFGHLRLSRLGRVGQVNTHWGYSTVQDVVRMQNAETSENLTNVCLKSSLKRPTMTRATKTYQSPILPEEIAILEYVVERK